MVLLSRVFGLLGMVVVAGYALHGAVAEAEIKIAYVDMAKAIETSSAGKKAKKSLEGEFNKLQKDITKREEDIKKMTDDLEKKKTVLSDDVRLKKQEAIQEEMLKYRELVTRSQADIAKRQADLLKPIVEKIKEITGVVAKEKGIGMVVPKTDQTLVWAQPDLDLTAAVMERYEKTLTK